MDEKTDEWMNQESCVSIGEWQLTNAGLIFMEWLGFNPDKDKEE